MRATGAPCFVVSARAITLGLFFVLVACVPPDRHRIASDADRAAGTGLFTWLVDHDPSALVAWHVDPERLRPLAPDASPVVVAASSSPCAQAKALHAALVLLASDRTPQGRLDRATAFDCGAAIFHDRGGIVVAPR